MESDCCEALVKNCPSNGESVSAMARPTGFRPFAWAQSMNRFGAPITRGHGARSTERPADVVLRMLFARIAEDPIGVLIFDEVAGAAALRRIDVEERRAIGDALGLLQIVRDDHDGELLLQLLHQVLDLARR